MPDTAIVFDPSGVARDVPYDQLTSLVSKGATPAVNFQAPDGKVHPVPANRTQDAIKAGGKILPFESQEVQHPGFWASMYDDLKGMVKGGAETASNAMAAADGNPIPMAGQLATQAISMKENDQHRAAQGRSDEYRAIAPVGELLGANVRGMEDSADEGDMGGVLGHAAAVPTAMAATAGVARAIGPVADLADTWRKQTGTPAGAYVGLPEKPPAEVLQGRGLAQGGQPYVAPSAGLGNIPVKAQPEPVFPGANQPSVPPTEALQAAALQKGARPVTDPAAGLSKIPVKSEPEPVYPGASQPEAPSTAVLQAQALMKAGGKLPVQQEAALGTIPVGKTAEPAPAPVLSKAQLAKALETELNNAMGGKPLQPNVPLRNQKVVPPTEAPSTSTGGFTPVDSSAVKSFKYDPSTQELHVQTPGGGGYVYGEVTPAQAEDFASGNYRGQGKDDAPSVGKAWKDIRDSSVQVRKMVNGKWVATKPPTGLGSVDPLADAHADLTAILQKTLEAAKSAGASQ